MRGDGDNLFTDSVVALDPDTGQRKWHYQFTPNDGHDWDSTEDMVLVDRVWRGQHAQAAAARRSQRAFLRARSHHRRVPAGTPFIHQNWNKGFDANGRPIVVPGSNSSRGRQLPRLSRRSAAARTSRRRPTARSPAGSTWNTHEGGQRIRQRAAGYEKGRQYLGRDAAADAAVPRGPDDPAPIAGIKAIDPETGKTVWDFKLFQGSLTNGVLATAGGVLFAVVRDGNIIALDARTGKHLWHFQTGGNMAASPMSYAVDGRQYVADRVPATRSTASACRSRGRDPAALRHRRCCRLLCSHGRLRPLAQRYAARRSGDVVQLEDAAPQTVVSITPSVGNVAFEMTVKGHDVLRWPYASVEDSRPAGTERNSVPRAVGQPARRAGVLRERKEVRVRHGARQRARRDSHPRVPDRPISGRS